MADGVGVNKDDEALSALVKKYQSAEDSSVEARRSAERCRDYYDGDQTWTAEEKKKLKARKQPAITINRIKPKIDFLLGMEVKNRTDPKAYPRTPKHEGDADAATQALRFVLDENNFKRTKSKAWENLLLEGECGVDIYVKPRYEGVVVVGKDIHIKRVSWDRMFIDPHSRETDRSDATYLGQVVWMDLAFAERKWPESKLIFEQTLTSERNDDSTYGDRPRMRWVDPSRKRVRVVEMWFIEDGEWKHAIFTRNGFLEMPRVSEYKDEDGNTEHSLEFQAAYIDRDGNAYGTTRSWLDMQDEINRRRSKALHLLNVRQAKITKSEFPDSKKVREELAKPDGLVESTTNDPNAIQILPTGDMAKGQFELLQEAKAELDAVGVNAALAGQDQRVMSGRAILARQESGMAELGPNFEALRDWELRVYRKVWNRIKQFWDQETWVRVTDDENNVKFVGLNRPMVRWQSEAEMLAQQGQQVSPEMLQMMQMDPSKQDTVVQNEVAKLDVDIVVAEVPDTATMQAEQFEQLTQLASSGFPLPPEVLIEASNLTNKAKLLDIIKGKTQEGGIPPQVQEMLQKAQEEIRAAQEDLQKREMALQQKTIALMKKEYQYNVEELEVRKTESQHQALATAATAQANMAKAAADRDIAVAEAQGANEVKSLLKQVMQEIAQLKKQGVSPITPSNEKRIEIMTPEGKVYQGVIAS